MPYEKRGQPLFLLLSELRVYLQHRGNKERDSTGAHDDYEEIAVAYRLLQRTGIQARNHHGESHEGCA